MTKDEEIAELKKTIAAEREQVKQWQQRFEQAAADSYAYAQQLLQAQAAIAEIRKGIYPAITHVDAQWLKEIIESIDLSALDKHDEEVRKPLVDALRSIQAAHTLNDANDIAADALAKVKERKS